MKSKTILKIAIDFIMTVLLLLLMAFRLTGQKAHEWLGAAMFVSFIIHNVLNFKWYRNLFKGKYTAFRIIQTAINLLVFASMIGLMVSGVIMSRHVFDPLPIRGSISLARELHMFASYWGFILMSLHLGFHWGIIMSMMRKAVKIRVPSRILAIVLRIIAILIAAYGIYAFIQHDLISYLFLKNKFVFFDYEQPTSLFFIDYLAMVGAFVFIAYYITSLIQKCFSKRNKTGGVK